MGGEISSLFSSKPAPNAKFYVEDMAKHGVPDMRPTLDKIGKVMKNWTDILENHKDSSKVTPAEYQYLVYQIQETEQDWKTLVMENPTLRASVYKRENPHNPAMPGGKDRGRVQTPPKGQQDNTDALQKTIKELSVQLEETKRKHSNQIQFLEGNHAVVKNQVTMLQEENKALTLRLSKLAADKLLTDNPNIADLSDPNRPTKLGEVYSELYDNEYTDAHSVLLDHGYTEREAIDTLRETLLNAFEFCSEKAIGILTTTEDAIKYLFPIEDGLQAMNSPGSDRKRHQKSSSTLMPGDKALICGPEMTSDIADLKFALKWKPKDRSKQLEENRQSVQDLKATINNARETKTQWEVQMKKIRKETGFSMVTTVIKAYLKTRWDKECIVKLKPFVKKCVLITWIMSIQTPPMAFLEAPPTDKEEELNGGQYRAYTKSGKVLDYVVWPAMMLTKDGAIIMKGVAQGKGQNGTTQDQ